MRDQTIDKVLALYGVTPATIYEPRHGYRNYSYRVDVADAPALNVMIFKSESNSLARIKRADMVSYWCAQRGLPTRQKADQRTIRIQSDKSARFIQLYQYLPGQTISWEMYTMKHIKLLGWAMSDMHYVLADLDHSHIDITIADELTELILTMRHYFSDDGVRLAMKQKLQVTLSNSIFDDFDKAVSLDHLLPEQHMIHMDMVRGNILFRPTSVDATWSIGDVELSGVIDFEKTAFGSAIFDIARSYAFLLVDCRDKSPEKIYKYFITSGYNKRGRAFIDMQATCGSMKMRQLFEIYVQLFLLHDFYKFLQHTPYESLQQNHHYVRTRDILNNQAMVRYKKEI